MEKIIKEEQTKAIMDLLFQANIPVKTYDLIGQLFEKLPEVKKEEK